MRSTTLSPFHARTSATATRAAMANAPSLRSELILEELEHRDLVAAQRRRPSPARALARRLLRQRHDASLEISLDQRRVHVVLAAHGARVSEAVRDEVDGLDDVAVRLAARRRRALGAQRH